MDEIQDELFQQIKNVGESLKLGPWTDDELAALRAIAADVAALEAKALLAQLDPARAAMYRMAADRALDSAANLALVRVQAAAAQLDSLRASFLTRLWNAILGLLPGLSSAPATEAEKK
jgi:hypothetical protein